MEVNLSKSWFIIGPSKDISTKPISFALRGKKFVIYRTESNKVVAMTALCPHMGVDISIAGKVKGDCITCMLHGWKFSDKGSCEEIPGTKIIPEHAKLTSYPVTERNGVAYIFNHKTALFPLPFFEGESPEDFHVSKVIDIIQDGTWYVPAVNIFDVQHFAFSHGRHPRKPSVFDYGHEHMARVIHYFSITPKFNLEKIFIRFFGNQIDINAEVWGGNAIVIKSKIGFFQSRMIAYCTPKEKTASLTRMVVYRPKSGFFLLNLIEKVLIKIQASFVKKMFQVESDEFKGLMLRENNLHSENDKELIEYLAWWKIQLQKS